MMDSSKHEPGIVSNLSVTHDPEKFEFFALLTCFIICLCLIAGFANALINHQTDPVQDRDVTLFAVVAFSLAALFFLGWSSLVLWRRKKNKRVYLVDGSYIQCSDGSQILWREPVQYYQNICWCEEQLSYLNRYGRQFYTVQVIKLNHPRTERCFKIYSHQDSPQLQLRCKQWADALSLSIVRTEADN